MLTLEINAKQPWLIAPDGNVAEITRRLAITPRSIQEDDRKSHHARTFAALCDTKLPKLLGGDSISTEPTNEMKKFQ